MANEREGTEFSEFISGFAATAASILAQLDALLERGPPGDGEATRAGGDHPEATGDDEDLDPDEVAEQVRVGLPSVQRLIETLAMLEGKTQGNLTDEESSLLQNILTELRFGFLKTKKRAEPHGTGPEGGKE